MPVYNSFKKSQMDNPVDLLTADVKLALLTSGYTPDIDAHDNFDDVQASEASGTGYTAGGQSLANKTVTQDNTDNEGVFDADDVTWSGSTITARYAVLYVDTGVAGTSRLIAYYDFGSDQSSSSADFTVQFNAEGVLNFT